jgi:hypothetical protein
MLKFINLETQTLNQNLQIILIIRHINAKPEKVRQYNVANLLVQT